MKIYRAIIYILALGILATGIQSCEEPFDYTMSLTSEEQEDVMQGTWVLTRAGTDSPTYDENGESHIENNALTELESVNITPTQITFNFRTPVKIFYRSEETGYQFEEQEEVQTYTTPHDIGTIPNMVIVDTNEGETPMLTLGFDEISSPSSGQFTFFTKDDVHAIRMIIQMSAYSFHHSINYGYLEFERQ